MAIKQIIGPLGTSKGGATGDWHRKDSGNFKKTLKSVYGFINRLRGRKRKKRFKTAKTGSLGVRG